MKWKIWSKWQDGDIEPIFVEAPSLEEAAIKYVWEVELGNPRAKVKIISQTETDNGTDLYIESTSMDNNEEEQWDDFEFSIIKVTD